MTNAELSMIEVLLNATVKVKIEQQLEKIKELETEVKRLNNNLFTSLGGVARVRETPSSIPNLEVKTHIADNTAGYAGGNVGRCRLEIFILNIYFLFYIQSFF